jgi:hypothetical protein
VVCLSVTMKPRRNEEAQAHIGLSSHRKKIIFLIIKNRKGMNCFKIVDDDIDGGTGLTKAHF